MTYTQAMEYIGELGKFGIVPGLDNIKALLSALSHPERRIKIIHIAGTNGKGSTGAFIAAMLREKGLCVGRYVSPTVFCYEERFQINGQNIAPDDLAKYIGRVKNAAEKAGITPTVFEAETAAALCYFEKCDIVLLEVGMGGRLDATNAAESVLRSVITPIAFDHMAYLGNTLGEIAFEKAGIIKQNGVVVTAPQQAEAMAVLEKTAAEKNARLIKTGTPEIKPDGSFDYKDLKGLKIKMQAQYQYINACLAIEVYRSLFADEAALRRGLEKAEWRGRFQMIEGDPLFIFDGAHNPHGVAALTKSLEKYGKCVFICGIFADKAYPEMVKTAAGLTDCVFTVTPPSPRGLDAAVLKAEFLKYTDNVTACDLAEALEKADKMKGRTVVVFGSLSFLGDAIRIVGKNRI